ncbi:MAG: hypothetical protein GXP14_15230 [Gammaproteobacteria bacterium]|nr:hypothetical protein [Gammaproteobacteria bacterium]
MLQMISFIVAVLLSGCASMFNGTSQELHVRSNDDNVKFYVNEAYIGKGSAVTTLKKKNEYMITAKKEGCDLVTRPITKSFDGTTLLGLFIDLGIFSILLIDGAATGAWQSFDQTNYIIDPIC